MSNAMSGYYKVLLESNGHKKPLVVFALSEVQAAAKALYRTSRDLPGAQIREIDGPYIGPLN